MIRFARPDHRRKLLAIKESIVAFVSFPTSKPAHAVPNQTVDKSPPLELTVTTQEASTPAPTELVKSTGSREEVEAVLRQGVMHQLARMMMDKLVQKLLSQRALLLGTQQTAALQVVELEQRLTKIQEQLQTRFDAYEKRVSELERQLAAKEQENRALARDKFLIAKKALEAEEGKESVRVDLRDAGFLLRT